MLAAGRAYLLERKIAKPGDRIVVTAGVPFHISGTTNMLRVEQI
jgi:pyruvate kinase